MLNSGIYKIENKINGRAYIGSTVDFLKRKQKHFCELKSNCHHNLKLQRSYNKNGAQQFSFEILAKCPKEYLFKLEQRFIDIINPEYNINKKATGGRLSILSAELVKTMIKEYSSGNISSEFLCEKYKISRTSFYNYINKAKGLEAEAIRIKKNKTRKIIPLNLAEKQVCEIKYLIENQYAKKDICRVYNIKNINGICNSILYRRVAALKPNNLFLFKKNLEASKIKYYNFTYVDNENSYFFTNSKEMSNTLNIPLWKVQRILRCYFKRS